MSKTLKQICDAAMSRAGLGTMSSYFGSGDETIAYLANESLESLIRVNKWQKLRKTGTISMTAETFYSMPSDIKFYVADTMNADGQERFIQFPTSDNVWWYFKSHDNSGIRYKVRQTDGRLEILNPDPGVDLIFEYISSNPVISNAANSADGGLPDKTEFTRDDDVWLLDDELIILDLKWRFMSIKGVEGWEKEKMVFNDHLKVLKGHDGGSTTLNFTSPSRDISELEPWTDLYI